VWSSLRQTLRLLRHWVPFTARTVFYGSVSLLLGPLTPDRRASHWAQRAWSRSGLRFLSISVDVQGLENVPAGGYAYACNHQSLLDTLVLGATLPGDFKWTVKSSLMMIPFLGWHLWLAGHVRVERDGDRRAAASAIRRFARVLAEGKPLLVFPEGTRSKDGRVKPFKMGLFYAAVRAGVPVVPVALHGTGTAMAKGAPDIGRREIRRVYLRIGEPVAPSADGSGPERASDLRDRTHAAVVDMHRALASTAYPTS
jgi:1-acyl-sn-glycerol-3-phosphate acyltransferase